MIRGGRVVAKEGWNPHHGKRAALEGCAPYAARLTHGQSLISLAAALASYLLHPSKNCSKTSTNTVHWIWRRVSTSMCPFAPSVSEASTDIRGEHRHLRQTQLVGKRAAVLRSSFQEAVEKETRRANELSRRCFLYLRCCVPLVSGHKETGSTESVWGEDKLICPVGSLLASRTRPPYCSC